jgi:hypothetical protein
MLPPFPPGTFVKAGVLMGAWAWLLGGPRAADCWALAAGFFLASIFSALARQWLFAPHDGNG